MKELKKEVKEVINHELTRANEKFPMFASNHEAYAVILEEFEETKHELDFVESCLCVAWRAIKSNSDAVITGELELCRKKMLLCACEAIQTAAMFEKAICSMDDRPQAVIPKSELMELLKRMGVKIYGGEKSEETEERE